MVLEGWFGEFRLLGFEFSALRVDHEPKGLNIWFLRVNLGPLFVDLGSLGVDIESMGVNFNALRVEFKFSELIWAS